MPYNHFCVVIEIDVFENSLNSLSLLNLTSSYLTLTWWIFINILDYRNKDH